MADLSLLLSRGRARFAPDARFDAGETNAPEPEAAPSPPTFDPLADAREAGFAAGWAAGRAEALAQAESQHATIEQLRASVARLDAERAETLRQRLLDTVVALCEATLAPLALDMPTLARRVQRAVAMFARADDERVIRLHPEDLAAVHPLLPADWTFLADAALERGALRVEAQTGGAEDGPAQWRQAIAEAIGSC